MSLEAKLPGDWFIARVTKPVFSNEDNLDQNILRGTWPGGYVTAVWDAHENRFSDEEVEKFSKLDEGDRVQMRGLWMVKAGLRQKAPRLEYTLSLLAVKFDQESTKQGQFPPGSLFGGKDSETSRIDAVLRFASASKEVMVQRQRLEADRVEPLEEILRPKKRGRNDSARDGNESPVDETEPYVGSVLKGGSTSSSDQGQKLKSAASGSGPEMGNSINLKQRKEGGISNVKVQGQHKTFPDEKGKGTAKDSAMDTSK